ncbi:MAG: nicotinate (nicotinamide) nucleotide adenylyltransferase [Actinobacteria bacterium]|nr:nicotinate (nicotinamide) nucleotide adenylyltransferase [Actinomycetota bacterium]
MSLRRIALFGGTFDPPHIGHLVVANEVRVVGGFDEVILMVANDPWQKSSKRTVSPAAVRLEMVQAAVAGHDGLVAGDAEIRRGGASYTVDTIEALTAEQPDAVVSVVVGDDAARSLDTWHRSEDLARSTEVVVVGRPGAPDVVATPGWNLRRIEVPQLDISSTEIRRRAGSNGPIDFLVPERVVSTIAARGLYGFGS